MKRPPVTTVRIIGQCGVEKFSLDWLARYRLVTIWDMIQCAPGKLAVLLTYLDEHRKGFIASGECRGITTEILSTAERVPMLELLGGIVEQCRILALTRSVDRLEKLII